MANLKDLVVNGNARIVGTTYGTFNGPATQLARDGNTANPMTFHWNGQSGQPPWLWGGSDGTNMYVYNPSNFSVNYANSAGGIADGVTIDCGTI